MRNSLRLALDLGPLLAFFIAFRLAGLAYATTALIICTLLSLAFTYAHERRIAVMPLVSGVAVTIFGSLTLVLHDDYFIKIKPTLVNLLFATILLVGVYRKRPMLKYLLESAFQLTEQGWLKLSTRWGLFFIFLAGVNELIWRNFSTDFWVSFKVFGMFGLTLIFTFSQIPLIKKYWIEPTPNA